MHQGRVPPRGEIAAGDGGFLQLDIEDLRCQPLTEMARRHRSVHDLGQFRVNRVAFTHERGDERDQLIIVHDQQPPIESTPRRAHLPMREWSQPG
jgi:hypothetical protein